jgi:hypothetical protein
MVAVAAVATATPVATATIVRRETGISGV